MKAGRNNAADQIGGDKCAEMKKFLSFMKNLTDNGLEDHGNCVILKVHLFSSKNLDFFTLRGDSDEKQHQY
jgi:hypothetical protein